MPMSPTILSESIRQLKFLFPPSRFAAEIVKSPWYIAAAVAFSSSNKPEGVSRVFENVLEDLESQNADKSDKLLLAQKLREALFKSGLITGYPKAINGLKALHEIMPEDLKDRSVRRDTGASLASYEVRGSNMWKSVYGEQAESVQNLLNSVYPDMGWFSKTIGYGVVYSQPDVLSTLETSYILIAALIAGDTPQQLAWHLEGAKRGGATLAEIQAVRELSMEVAKLCGVRRDPDAQIPDVSAGA